MNELILEIKWQNEDRFEVTSKLNDEDPITIILVEENGCIEGLWPGISGLMHTYLSQQLKHIGKDMSQ